MSYTIQSDNDRNSVADLVRTLKDGMRVEIKHGRRSPEQNNLMWERLNDISEQVTWHGQKLEQSDWKDMFTAGLRRARIVPNIDGDGFVQLGLHTSDLTKEEMSNLLDLMDAFAANHGVTFKESNSPDGRLPSAPSDTPAAETGPQSVKAAGVTLSNWFDFYLERLTRSEDEALSLLSRHERAIKDGLGAIVKDDENKLAVMRKAWRLVRERNENAITLAEYDLRIGKLRSIAMGTRHNSGDAA